MARYGICACNYVFMDYATALMFVDLDNKKYMHFNSAAMVKCGDHFHLISSKHEFETPEDIKKGNIVYTTESEEEAIEKFGQQVDFMAETVSRMLPVLAMLYEGMILEGNTKHIKDFPENFKMDESNAVDVNAMVSEAPGIN